MNSSQLQRIAQVTNNAMYVAKNQELAPKVSTGCTCGLKCLFPFSINDLSYRTRDPLLFIGLQVHAAAESSANEKNAVKEDVEGTEEKGEAYRRVASRESAVERKKKKEKEKAKKRER